MMRKGGSSFSLLSASVLLGTLILLLSAFVQEGQGLKCHNGTNTDYVEEECGGECNSWGYRRRCDTVETEEGTKKVEKGCSCGVLDSHKCTKFFDHTGTIHIYTKCVCGDKDFCNELSCGESHTTCGTFKRSPPTTPTTSTSSTEGVKDGNSGATTPTLFLTSVPALIIITSSYWAFF